MQWNVFSFHPAAAFLRCLFLFTSSSSSCDKQFLDNWPIVCIDSPFGKVSTPLRIPKQSFNFHVSAFFPVFTPLSAFFARLIYITHRHYRIDLAARDGSASTHFDSNRSFGCHCHSFIHCLA
jgi:hypothetical protein